jgi:hypothetical protein
MFFIRRSIGTLKNPILVRIWDPTKTSVGHVSLETSQYYISLWPASGASKPDIKWNSFDGKLIDSLEKDEIANGDFNEHGLSPKAPTTIFTLRSVSESVINSRYEELRHQNLQWALAGDNKMFFKENVHSCASLVILFLKEGGLDALFKKYGKNLLMLMKDDIEVATHKLIQNNIIVTPTNVKRVLEYAVRLENDHESENKLSI